MWTTPPTRRSVGVSLDAGTASRQRPAHSRGLRRVDFPHPCCPLPPLGTTEPRTTAGRACARVAPGSPPPPPRRAHGLAARHTGTGACVTHAAAVVAPPSRGDQ